MTFEPQVFAANSLGKQVAGARQRVSCRYTVPVLLGCLPAYLHVTLVGLEAGDKVCSECLVFILSTHLTRNY